MLFTSCDSTFCLIIPWRPLILYLWRRQIHIDFKRSRYNCQCNNAKINDTQTKLHVFTKQNVVMFVPPSNNKMVLVKLLVYSMWHARSTGIIYIQHVISTSIHTYIKLKTGGIHFKHVYEDKYTIKLDLPMSINRTNTSVKPYNT